MVNDFFKKLVVFSNRNGQIIVLFGLILLSVSFFSVGLILKKLEDHRIEYNNIINNRLGLLKAKYEIKNDEFLLNLRDAKKTVDAYKNEYLTKLEHIKTSFQIQLKRYDLENEKRVHDRDVKIKEELTEIHKSYEEESNKLMEYRKDLKLNLEKIELDKQKELNDIASEYREEYSKILEKYSSESVKLSQVRTEIEYLLNELQKDFEELEKILAEQYPSQAKKYLHRLFLVRIKLNVFLTEYRDSLEKKYQITLPKLSQIKPIKFEEASYAYKPIDWITQFASLGREVVYSNAADSVDIDTIFEKAGPPPELSINLPEIDIDKLLSVKGLVELVGIGYAWVVPIIVSFILISFSIFYGLFLIKEEKLSNSDVKPTGSASES